MAVLSGNFRRLRVIDFELYIPTRRSCADTATSFFRALILSQHPSILPATSSFFTLLTTSKLWPTYLLSIRRKNHRRSLIGACGRWRKTMLRRDRFVDGDLG